MLPTIDLDRVQAMRQAIARAGGPPSHLRSDYARACRLLDAAADGRSGVGWVWMIPWAIGVIMAAGTAVLSYSVVRETARVGDEVGTQVVSAVRAAGEQAQSIARWVPWLVASAGVLWLYSQWRR